MADQGAQDLDEFRRIAEHKAREDRIRRTLWLRAAIAVLISSVVASAVLITSFRVVDPTREGVFVDKLRLQQQMEKAIKGGADLRAVRQLFNSRERQAPDFRSLFGADRSSARYREPLALTTILEDLRASAFLQEAPDLSLVRKIDPLLRQHEQTNPFDKLAPNQRVDFETVRTRLGDNYGHVQQSIERIVNELDKQNQVASEYLADAKLGLYLSIVALIVGVIAMVPAVAEALKWFRRASH